MKLSSLCLLPLSLLLHTACSSSSSPAASSTVTGTGPYANFQVRHTSAALNQSGQLSLCLGDHSNDCCSSSNYGQTDLCLIVKDVTGPGTFQVDGTTVEGNALTCASGPASLSNVVATSGTVTLKVASDSEIAGSADLLLPNGSASLAFDAPNGAGSSDCSP